MRRFLIVLTVAAMASSLASCKQMGGMFGDKKVEEQKKMEEMAAKAAQMLAEQQKKEAEEKAKRDQEIQAEVEKRLAEMKAAETKPAEKPEEKLTEKVVEKIVIKEAAPAKPSGYVRLYEDYGFSGRSVTVPAASDVGNLNSYAGFNDKTSGVRYNVPAGWEAILYDDYGFGGGTYRMRGKGAISNLGSFNDRASSVHWERR